MLPAPDRGEIDRNQVRLARKTIDHLIARQLRVSTIGGILQTAARANEIAHVHRRFERIASRRLHPPVDAHDLFRFVGRRLQFERPEDGFQDAIAAGREVEHHDLIARPQFRIRRRTARREGLG